jgi:hypothetical protein
MNEVRMNALNSTLNPSLHHRIQTLAYEFWMSRGRPFGTPDEDWFKAEETVAAEVRGPGTSVKKRKVKL